MNLIIANFKAKNLYYKLIIFIKLNFYKQLFIYLMKFK